MLERVVGGSRPMRRRNDGMLHPLRPVTPETKKCEAVG